MLTVGSLFSGIGGFDLGLERAGMRVIWQSEIDPYASAVLRKHWPDVPNLGDIRTIAAERINKLTIAKYLERTTNLASADKLEPREWFPDVICGGFPCQPFSSANAGRARGKDDDRYLWPEMLRVIAELEPAWVCGENVAHLDRLALETVCADLEACGYEVQTLEIPACAVDADSIRNRLWILGHAYGDREPSGAQHAKASRRASAVPAYAYSESMVRPAIARSEHADWPDFPGMDRMADGLPHRMDRLKCLGNAIVPAVAEVIGRAIMNQAEA